MSSVKAANILNPDLRSRAEALAEQFKYARPYPYVAIPDFFITEFCKRLLDDFPGFDEELARNEMGEIGRKATHENVRDISHAYRELDDFIQTPEFLDLISQITGIPNLLYDPNYFGGGTHENLDGQGLDPHVDFNYHAEGWHRRLNLILYLNPEWEENWGGSFNLHSNPWEIEGDQVSTVLPLFNHCVIFETSERSWHGFSPIKLPPGHERVSRKSFAVYLYTEERPKEETAAEHSTVYVPRGIPDGVEPGEVLTEEQYNLLRAHFVHHRGMLQHLYKREQQFTSEIKDLRHQVASLNAALDQAREG